ncbi:MAG: hypothetical protein DCC71_14395 [Proteobacteria bacterium]|nr:MAG: hypothetical protein DCC71_14395 [Pseudomonadota bacterium]
MGDNAGMRTARSARPALWLAALLLAHGARAAAPSLPFSYESDSQDYLIRFTDQGDHALPLAQALDAADALDRGGNDVPGNPRGYHDGYADLGFATPFFTGDRLVDFWDCKEDDDTPCDNGQAVPSRIRMPTSNYSTLQNPGGVSSTEMCLRMVLGHELFHHVEFAYVDEAGGSGCGPWPDAACEGMARMMQDQIYTDVDTAPSSCISAQGEFDGYLEDTNRSIWDISYGAALWWKYLAEQYGTVAVEPERGADFVRRWWENAVDDFDTPDVLQVTRDTIQDFGDCCVNGAFHDFVLANLLKDFDLSNLSAAERARWSYVDSGQGFGQADYAAVDVFGNQSVSPGQPAGFSGFVSDYGVLYHGADVDQCPNTAQIRVTLDLVGGYQPTTGFAVVLLRGDEVIDVDKKTGTGWSWTRYVPVEPYTRVVTVMAGFTGALALDLDVRCLTQSGGVDFPLMMNPKPTHGGPPGSFANVDFDVDVFDERGSLRGLGSDAFEVWVGPPASALQADVLGVVDTALGQRLRVAVPAQLGAGAHRVAIRAAGEEITADGALLRGERRPDQLVLFDRSQSMATPAGGATRFALAQRAARLFADAAPDASQLGLVAFAGDGAEPNDDAVEALPLAALAPAQRSAFDAALGALPAPSGPTSIGDALAAAARIFGASGAAGQERHAVLLSDGAESEASAWPAVRGAVLASGMRVHAIALGANADQGLLAEIATETQGSFEFVAETPAETLQSRLADAFLRAAERANARQRFVETQADLVEGVPASIAIPVRAAGRASFAVHWDDPADAVGVELLDPSGAAVPGASVVRDVSALRADVELAPHASGAPYTLRLTAQAGSPTVAIAGAGAGAEFDGAYLLTSVAHQASHAVQQGGDAGRSGGVASALPVAIQASLVDAAGPIAGAAGEAEVEHPDGTTQRLALLDDGRGADAAAHDGVYTALYRRTTAAGPTGLPETAPGARGSYRVKVRFPSLPGAAPAPGRFDAHAFWVGAGDPLDGDGDGLLDRYEALHECVAATAAGADPDGDRASSAQELAAGTDPCEADGDGGGEHDGSELARGASPLDPSDDALPAPGWLGVVTRINELHVPQDARFVPQPNANLLRVPSAPEYALLVVERRERAGATALPWMEIARVDPRTLGGAYLDDGLVAGLVYDYRLRGVDAAGNESAPSQPVTATVKQDPLAPIGALRIERPRTDARALDVAVDLYLDDPAQIEMRVAGPRDRAAAFTPYAALHRVTLPAVTEPTPTRLRATLRDAAGNESLPYAASIVQYPEGSLGSIEGVVEPAAGGVLVRIAGRPEEPIAVTGSDGRFVLRDLLPGSYTIEAIAGDARGFAGGVSVAAGDVTDAGVVPVPEPGAIAGALAALAALRRLAAARAAAADRSRASRRRA